MGEGGAGHAGRQSSEIGLRVFWGMSRERERRTMRRGKELKRRRKGAREEREGVMRRRCSEWTRKHPVVLVPLSH